MASPSDNDKKSDDNTSTTWWCSFLLPPPSVVLGVASLPCFWQARVGYIQGRLLSDAHVATLTSQTAEEGVKRAAASQIATRALSVATWASMGTTLALTAVALLGYASLDQVLNDVVVVQHRTNRRQEGLLLNDKTSHQLGLHPDRSHEDFHATAHMNPDQEISYVAQKYFPGHEQWTEPISSDKEKE